MIRVERASTDQVDRIAAVADEVMRPWREPGGGMAARFPHLFSPQNAHNLYFVTDGTGHPVSVAAVMRRDIIVEGIRLKSASLGAVSTLATHRGQGYASAIVGQMMTDLERDRIDLLFVSGRRDLYFRADLVEAGSFLDGFWDELRDECLPEAMRAPCRVVPVTEPSLVTPAFVRLYGHEPVRFHRTEAYMAEHINALRYPRRGFQHRVFAYLEGDEVRAYGITVESPEEPSVLGLMEWAGSRIGVLRLLVHAGRESGRPQVRLWVQPLDATMRSLIALTGGQIRLAPDLGTVRLVDVRSFLTESAKWREERGIELHVSRRGTRFRIHRWVGKAENIVTVEGVGALTRWCFAPDPEGLGMPLPWAGDLNYV